jgi:putative colanic acid biosynthesis UDP-glucose lipid carrier transferase
MFVNLPDRFHPDSGDRSRGRAHENVGAARIDPDLIAQLIPLIAGALVFAAATMANFACRYFGLDHPEAVPTTLGVAGVAALIAYGVFRQGESLEPAKLKGRAFDARVVALTLAVAFALLFALLSLLGISDRYSLDFLSVWLGVSYALIVPALGAVSLYGRLLISEGRLLQRVALYGDGQLAIEVAKSLLDTEANSVIVGIFEDPVDPDNFSDQVQRRGISELVQCASEGGCDRIIVALAPGEAHRIKSVMERLEAAPVTVQLCTDAKPLPYKVQGIVTQGPMLLLDVQRHPLGARGIVIKSIMDYCLATAALVALAPLMVIIALAIKLDTKGPVFFVQARSGYRQKVINVIKFRSMNVLENGPVIVQAEPNDPRITRVGKFLRRTSLDELPQLINVMRGELSLVGPRPHAVAHDIHYAAIVEHYASRSKIKPGITGLAQVRGFRSGTRDPEMMRQRVKHDLLYMDNWSPWLDVKILFRTIGVVFWDRQAY